MIAAERIAACREKGREAIWYAAIMPDGGGVKGRTDALDRLIAFERAEAAYTTHLTHVSAPHYLLALPCLLGDCDRLTELAAAMQEIEEAQP